MAFHIELGKQGEQLAVDYLIKNGFTIIFRNWRYSRYEIDIIAEKNGVVHFVEVKLRSSKKSAFPEENVTRQKVKFILKAVDFFLYQHPQYKHIQLDIISIYKLPGCEPEYFFIQDIYL
jgi:putative endonuclease